MEKIAASFRDPSGFVFRRGGILYRQVNQVFSDNYRLLIDSGLHADLTERGALIQHEEVQAPPAEKARAFKVIRPRELAFISYPYEWCFSQLQDAALLTLDIQETALRRGMSLKDATAFNIQFENGRPIHIDTLSFEVADSGPPWLAYRQFCQHFLAPLALMAWRDPRLGRMLALHLDGIPLDLCCQLLPHRAFWHFHRWIHLWLHNVGQKRIRHSKALRAPASLQQRLALVDSLRSAVTSLQHRRVSSHWSQYESDRPSYLAEARLSKESIVSEMIASAPNGLLWDLGCNTGVFSRIAASHRAQAVAIDYDHDCIETLYRQIRKEPNTSILPLIIDTTNPSSALGWAGTERMSLRERGPAATVLALAIVHHWAFGNNLPLPDICRFLASCTDHLIIEFVPKHDPMSQLLLASRQDIFPDYSRHHFEQAMLEHFELCRSVALPGSERVLYHFRLRRGSQPATVARQE